MLVSFCCMRDHNRHHPFHTAATCPKTCRIQSHPRQRQPALICTSETQQIVVHGRCSSTIFGCVLNCTLQVKSRLGATGHRILRHEVVRCNLVPLPVSIRCPHSSFAICCFKCALSMLEFIFDGKVEHVFHSKSKLHTRTLWC